MIKIPFKMDITSALISDIGGSEWIIIILFGLVLLFGTKKLPQFSRTMGKAVGEYEKAKEMFRHEIEETEGDCTRGKQVSQGNGSSCHREKKTGVNCPLARHRRTMRTLTDEELRTLIAERMTS